MASEIKIPPDLCLDTPLWHFAGEFWSRPGAQKAALELQQQGWSVTDVLCALWLTTQARNFKGFIAGQASAAQILAWRSQVTEALRNMRKSISKGNPATNQTRQCIAGSELEAEKVELALAYRAITGNFSENVILSETVTLDNITVRNLALENLQAAAPEKAMDNETSNRLETLTEELQLFAPGDRRQCL